MSTHRKFLSQEERAKLPPPTQRTPWAIRLLESQKKETTAKARLVCFHFAGGSAGSFRAWDRELGPSVAMVAVELPGHQTRSSEPFLTNIHEIAKQVAQAILPFLDRPFFIFGHSAGTIIAFETIKVLAEKYNIAPSCFFASGSSSPNHARLEEGESPIHMIRDNNLFDRAIMDKYKDVTLETVKRQYPELLEGLRNAIRADMKAYETYEPTDLEPLPCPITVFCGKADTSVLISPEYLDNWQLFATPPSNKPTVLLEGGHFYYNQDVRQITSMVVRDIRTFL